MARNMRRLRLRTGQRSASVVYTWRPRKYVVNPDLNENYLRDPFQSFPIFRITNTVGIITFFCTRQRWGNMELVLICTLQGPPGTGKTYVGITLLRFLLSLKVDPVLVSHAWLQRRRNNEGSVPNVFLFLIFTLKVVAYKNHALDDFLEQSLECISSLEADLVRVPRPKDPQRTSQKLNDCSLGEVHVCTICFHEMVYRTQQVVCIYQGIMLMSIMTTWP